MGIITSRRAWSQVSCETLNCAGVSLGSVGGGGCCEAVWAAALAVNSSPAIVLANSMDRRWRTIPVISTSFWNQANGSPRVALERGDFNTKATEFTQSGKARIALAC